MNVNLNTSGDIINISKICIIQISHRNKEGIHKCYILNVLNIKYYILNFLSYWDIKLWFVGAGLVGDLAKIGRDFHSEEIIKNIKNVINLGKFARKRNVVKNRGASLQKIVNIALNESISKASTIRCSK